MDTAALSKRREIIFIIESAAISYQWPMDNPTSIQIAKCELLYFDLVDVRGSFGYKSLYLEWVPFTRYTYETALIGFA